MRIDQKKKEKEILIKWRARSIIRCSEKERNKIFKFAEFSYTYAVRRISIYIF